MSPDWRDALTRHLQDEHMGASFPPGVGFLAAQIERQSEFDYHQALHSAIHMVYVVGHSHQPGTDLSVSVQYG